MERNAEQSLDYSTPADPGLALVVWRSQRRYRAPDGRLVRHGETLSRIATLVIPPAWTDVWICLNPNGHLQATGKDARGRTQYRYHPRWIAERDSDKFASLHDFGGVLPRIRRRVHRDLASSELGKRRVLAAIVHLMDRTFIRVGDERYRRENGSIGATTLRTRHVKIEGSEVFLDFRGKSGKRQRIGINDRKVARVMQHCLQLPGDVLFQYGDAEDAKSVSASDVNEYLREISGTSTSSKDFRTWGGTLAAAAHLAREGRPEARSARLRNVREAIKVASLLLGNTPAVCRRSYVHPRVLESYEAGEVPEIRGVRGLRLAESALLALLEASARSHRSMRMTTRDKVHRAIRASL
jgi:DNA topoisomerase I